MQKLNNSIFDSSLIVNQNLSQTEFIIGKSVFAYIIFNKPNVWYFAKFENISH